MFTRASLRMGTEIIAAAGLDASFAVWQESDGSWSWSPRKPGRRLGDAPQPRNQPIYGGFPTETAARKAAEARA